MKSRRHKEGERKREGLPWPFLVGASFQLAHAFNTMEILSSQGRGIGREPP